MPRPLILILIASLLLTASTPSAMAQTGEPSREPVLRVETGMHTAAIKRVSADRTGRLFVTASDDKTARIWDAANGRLLRVLRPPLGEGDEGKLYAVALSPDGGTVAAGGYTSNELGNVESIYLFDSASGRMTRRIGTLPSLVLHLAFAPDGKRLAATLGDKNGVRVFDLPDGRQTGADADCDPGSFGADFSPDGSRLVTSCLDGFVRLYAIEAVGLRLVAKRAAGGGKQPVAVEFSPDGGKVAVGFLDSTAVSVLSSADLSFQFAPDTTGVNNGNLSRVAWSATGDVLFAGGSYRNGGANPIRVWADGGRGAAREAAAALDTIQDIQPLAGGGAAYGASGPAWGVISAAGGRTQFTASAVADYRNNREGFLISNDGAEVAFGYEAHGKSPARFSVNLRRLETGAGGGHSLKPPRETGLKVTDWRSADGPKLNGERIALDPLEISRSLAIAPGDGLFLIGTSFYVRLFDRTGKALWSVPAPGEAWAVNISGDGRVAAAAFGDGTIRWYRVTDSRELLAFFPHADKKRWVLWTPSGYYDASPGAEELIGWHVNNGRDAAADFFPIGQFRIVFYRPDVISKVLAAGDEQLALRQAEEEAGRNQRSAVVLRLLPPVVEILSPEDGAEAASGEVAVRFALRTPSGEPVTEVRALVDGRPAAAERNLPAQSADGAGAVRELRVAVPAGESQVSVIASNRFTTSVPATVRVRARGPASSQQAGADGGRVANAAASPAAAGSPFAIMPKLYVLAVGVSSYADPKLNLSFAAKDARDFVASWERQKGLLYREVVVKTLTDARATKDEILDGLDWIRRETTSKDVAVVLFAGHGVNDQGGQYYFLPHNADTERLLRSGVSFNDIRSTVSSIAGKTLFFIDTCHSGNVLGTTRRGIGNDLNGVVNELSSAENGAVVFAASTGRQYSQERAEWNNGAFTLAVVEGLGGRADFAGRGRITVNMLDLYISERVKELTRGQQTPTTAKPNTVPDFPVALKK
jgi:hypothetical protein